MNANQPPEPGGVLFFAEIATDRVYLSRTRTGTFVITWHTWSNGSWSIDKQRHHSLTVALLQVLTWLRCNVETL